MDNKCILEIVYYKNRNHISTSNSNKCLCGKEKYKSKTEKLQDFEHIESRDNLCDNCVNRYQKCIEFNALDRTPTVKCQCDRKTPKGFEKCNRIISAYEARELKHPCSPNSKDPVCNECYSIIRSVKSNSVTTKYENATPWLSASHS